MTRFWWRLVDVLSRTLDPDERDAVRGDIAESGETGGQALHDVLGLVVRRQAGLWKDWRPWVALVAVAPASMLLSRFSLHVADLTAIPIWMYVNNWDWGQLRTGFRIELANYAGRIFVQYLALGWCACVSGLALGFLSRRAVWANGVLFGLAVVLETVWGTPARYHSSNSVVFSMTFYNTVFRLIVMATLALFPALWGMKVGLGLIGRRRNI
jgi:hypothetical protein